MRVAFELTALELDVTGSARSIQALRQELESDDRVDLVAVAQPGRPAAGKSRRRIARGLSRELLYFPLRLPRRVHELGVDLLHCPVALAPVRCKVPVVLTVYDTLAWDHPEWLRRPNVVQQRLFVRTAARSAKCVLVPSAYTRRRAIELFDLEPGRVRVTPLGVGERFSPGDAADEALRGLGVERPYILTVGALQPRKNLESAIRAFESLVRAGAPHRLVVAGGRGWSDAQLLARLRASPAADNIVLTGHVSDEHLLVLYRGAECFLFASRYEGFGLPVLEAMACGAPVVSSDRTSLPEVVGDAGLLVDPDDAGALERALEDVLASPERRGDLRARGLARAAEFTWRRCADLTVSAYAQAAGRASGASSLR